MIWFSGIEKRNEEDGSVSYPEGSIDESLGYGRVRRNLIRALRRAGYLVQDGGLPPSEDCIQIAHTQPWRSEPHRSSWKRRTKHGILYTTFESGVLPLGWVEACNTFDAVWTTSEWCKRIFQDSGVEVPIFVVHHGVEPGAFPVLHRPVRRSEYVFLWMGMAVGDLRDFRMEEPVYEEEDEAFVERGGIPRGWYLSLGKDPESEMDRQARRARNSLADRKQGPMVREAFWRLKEAGRLGPDAKLVLKWLPGHSPRWNFGYELGGDEAHYGERMDHEELLVLLQNADCSVNPTRCEGFGLQPLEHLATGMPAIVTGWSGVEDWLFSGSAGHGISFPSSTQNEILPSGRDFPSNALGLPLGFEFGRGFYADQADRGFDYKGEADQEFGAWAQSGDPRIVDAHPKIAHLMDLMEWCYRNREEARELALEAAAVIHEKWTWDRAVGQVTKSLLDLGWMAEEPKWPIRFRNRSRLGLVSAA